MCIVRTGFDLGALIALYVRTDSKSACSMNVKEVLENDPGAYFIHDELLAPLKVMYKSLQDTGDDSIANARLLDCMRQVSSSPPTPPFSPVLRLAVCSDQLHCWVCNVDSNAIQCQANPR